jgi:hypothetical protein
MVVLRVDQAASGQVIYESAKTPPRPEPMGEAHGRFGDRRGDHKPDPRIVAQ